MQESSVTERRKIEERLQKKQAEIAALDEKIRAAKIYVAALHDVLKMDSDESDDSAETKLRAGSAVATAREIILARGEPVHLDDILEAMGKEANRDTKASLAGSIAAYVRREEIFTRPAPNTFGLVELGHPTVEDEGPNEPPQGFGAAPRAKPEFDDDDVPF